MLSRSILLCRSNGFQVNAIVRHETVKGRPLSFFLPCSYPVPLDALPHRLELRHSTQLLRSQKHGVPTVPGLKWTFPATRIGSELEQGSREVRPEMILYHAPGFLHVV